MKKDSDKNMIITFKLFEAMSETTPSYLMTLSEYKEKVSPILKAFYKFLKKNTDYLKPSSYYGVYHTTYDEYMEKEKEKDEKSYPGSWIKWAKKHAEGNWPNGKQAPKEVMDTYHDYLNTLSKIFGQSDLEKIESDETNSNKRSVRRALDDGIYVEMLKDGKIEYPKFEEILSSVGLKIPAGFNKKINFKPPTPKPIEKTEEEKTLILKRIKTAFDGFRARGVSAFNIGPRMTKNMYHISYSDVSMFKYVVDHWNFLNPEQIKELESQGEYLNLIKRVKQYVAKAGEKNIDFAEDSVYSKIIEEVKVAIQPSIDEHKEEIKEKILRKQDFIRKEKETLSEKEFEEKWAVKDYDRKGNVIGYDIEEFYKRTLEGKLLGWDEWETNKYIKEQQDAYQDREHGKLNLLFYKLKTRYPTINEFKFGDVSKRRTGLEFHITGYDSNDVIYRIDTNTIFAGGWNIQVYHMRWLMSVYVGNERVAVFKSENQS